MVSKSPFLPGKKEAGNFVVASLVMALAFAGFQGSVSIRSGLFYTGVSSLCLLIRGLGQRIVAAKATGQSYLHLSIPGSVITLGAGLISISTATNLLLLFPIYTTFGGVAHEEWGKSTDAMWMKRQTWIIGSGIAALLAASLMLESAGLSRIASSIAVFAAFQMIPFDFEELLQVAPGVGSWHQVLDGAYILRIDSWRWMLLTGSALLAVALT